MKAVIEAQHNREIASCDIPHTNRPSSDRFRRKSNDCKICGKLVDILCEMDNLYMEHITEKRN
jgi:hypothetical protein